MVAAQGQVASASRSRRRAKKERKSRVACRRNFRIAVVSARVNLDVSCVSAQCVRPEQGAHGSAHILTVFESVCMYTVSSETCSFQSRAAVLGDGRTVCVCRRSAGSRPLSAPFSARSPPSPHCTLLSSLTRCASLRSASESWGRAEKRRETSTCEWRGPRLSLLSCMSMCVALWHVIAWVREGAIFVVFWLF